MKNTKTEPNIMIWRNKNHALLRYVEIKGVLYKVFFSFLLRFVFVTLRRKYKTPLIKRHSKNQKNLIQDALNLYIGFATLRYTQS